MKGILLDENLPSRITIVSRLPVISVLDLGSGLSDSDVWRQARQRRLIIVSKDSDFSDRIILADPPPWVVHLRFGNVRRKEFHAILAAGWTKIERLLKTHKLVNVYRDHIEAIR